MIPEGRLPVELRDGTVIVFSDAHYWPGVITTAHRALVKLVEALEPELIIANGDMLDGARISKHARIGWQKTPRLRDEMGACQERLNEVEQARKKARRIWPLGNHDARFETYLANNAAEFAGIAGFSLREHFPAWEPCWSVEINRNTIIKHRWKGGINATIRNVIEAGTNIFTGHLHALRTSPYSDYTGTRFGVDTGTLADPYGPQFQAYTEDAAVNWRSGLVVATYRDYQLLWPEEVHVIGEGEVSFRGKVLQV